MAKRIFVGTDLVRDKVFFARHRCAASPFFMRILGRLLLHNIPKWSACMCVVRGEFKKLNANLHSLARVYHFTQYFLSSFTRRFHSLKIAKSLALFCACTSQCRLCFYQGRNGDAVCHFNDNTASIHQHRPNETMTHAQFSARVCAAPFQNNCFIRLCP